MLPSGKIRLKSFMRGESQHPNEYNLNLSAPSRNESTPKLVRAYNDRATENTGPSGLKGFRTSQPHSPLVGYRIGFSNPVAGKYGAVKY